MRSVQDSVLPEGCGGEVSPHISSLLIHQSTDAQHRNPQGRQARNPQHRRCGYMRPRPKGWEIQKKRGAARSPLFLILVCSTNACGEIRGAQGEVCFREGDREITHARRMT